MHRYWDVIVEPLMNIIRPGNIVEVGSESGASTSKLLEFCVKNNCKLNSIDPFPQFNADDWVKNILNIFLFIDH